MIILSYCFKKGRGQGRTPARSTTVRERRTTGMTAALHRSGVIELRNDYSAVTTPGTSGRKFEGRPWKQGKTPASLIEVSHRGKSCPVGEFVTTEYAAARLRETFVWSTDGGAGFLNKTTTTQGKYGSITTKANP